MRVIVSLSPSPRAQPPRTNPFLRSSSDAPPFPCMTPSTVTCVVVVSFMEVVPSLVWPLPVVTAPRRGSHRSPVRARGRGLRLRDREGLLPDEDGGEARAG